MRSLVALAVFAALVAVASAFGATYMPGDWYAGLDKPSWTPPPVVFAPVWTVLYVMIALAGWLAWRAQGTGVLVALWLLQLIFNAAWSYLMFGRHEIGLALADIAALWLSNLAFVVAAWSPARPASLLFLPYLAWVSFAAALNFEVWRLNALG